MRELAINAEKWYQITHDLKLSEGEEFAKEYETRGEKYSCLRDIHCQTIERCDILKITNKKNTV